MKSIALSLWLLTVAAFADPISVELRNNAQIGKSVPAVVVHIQEPIAGFELKLKRSDGKQIDIKGGGRAGTTRVLDLAQPEGKFSYEGELTINMPNGETGSMPLQFEAALVGPMRVTYDQKEEEAAVPQRKVIFRASHPVAKAHLMVRMDTGAKAIDDDINLNNEPPGTPIELTWPEKPGKVMQISVHAYDEYGQYNGLELFPWFIDIPHEDVNFDSAKWDIRAEERPKLDKALSDIQDAVQKYGEWAEIKLYVVGHTDTVGGSDYNRGLSLSRAKSIGGYFRSHGLRIPIFFTGLGEDAPLVPTPDETDEPRNRRAEYIISIESPTKNWPVAPKWTRL